MVKSHRSLRGQLVLWGSLVKEETAREIGAGDNAGEGSQVRDWMVGRTYC